MKNKIVRVIKTLPRVGQDPIGSLVGKTFPVKYTHKNDVGKLETYEVEAEEFGGVIQLNPDEVEVVK